MISQVYAGIKTHQIVHFKYTHFIIVCQIYTNKAI